MIRTRHQEKEIIAFEELSILFFPLQGYSSIVYLVLALIFSCLIVFSRALFDTGLALFFFPMWVVSVAAIVDYGFVILDFTSVGRPRPPKFSAEMLLAQFDSRLAKEMIYLGTLASLIAAIPILMIQLALLIISLLVFPAATAFISMEGSMFSGFNLIRLFQFIKQAGFGVVTVKLLLIEIALGALLFLAIQNFQTLSNAYLFLGTCVVVYLILMLFRCIGVLLHSRRAELGLSTEFSPEQQEMERKQQEDAKRSDIIFDLHQLLRSNAKVAWQTLEATLKKDNYESEAEYFHAISEWQHSILMLKMAQGYIERLLERNDTHRAWDIFELCHSRSDGKFQLLSGKTVMNLCEVAYKTNHYKLAVEQLSHFEKDFPNHPGLKDALYLAVQLCSANLNDFEQARIHLGSIEEKFPNAPQEERFQILSALLVT